MDRNNFLKFLFTFSRNSPLTYYSFAPLCYWDATQFTFSDYQAELATKRDKGANTGLINIKADKKQT